MKKTIEEWFNTLEEPYRSAAIRNCMDGRATVFVPSISVALAGAFSWSHAPEGIRYWATLYDKHLSDLPYKKYLKQ